MYLHVFIWSFDLFQFHDHLMYSFVVFSQPIYGQGILSINTYWIEPACLNGQFIVEQSSSLSTLEVRSLLAGDHGYELSS